MEQPRRDIALDQVAASTIMAAHRRDHEHGVRTAQCHPHAVEVVHLGDRAVMVCHDCGTDTGFLPHRHADRLAHEHRDRTQDASGPLSASAHSHAA